MESTPYIDAIQDWAKNRSKCAFVLSENELKERVKPQSQERAQADVEFALGQYLYKIGKGAYGIPHFKEAQ